MKRPHHTLSSLLGLAITFSTVGYVAEELEVSRMTVYRWLGIAGEPKQEPNNARQRIKELWAYIDRLIAQPTEDDHDKFQRQMLKHLAYHWSPDLG